MFEIRVWSAQQLLIRASSLPRFFANTVKTNLPIWPTRYVPAPELPRWFRKALVNVEGRNPADETQGIWRVVWGMDAREFMNGDPNAIKYPNPNEATLGWACWILERWVKPQFFKRQEWEDLRYGADSAGTGKLIDYLGPYRTQGQYITVYPLISEAGEPLELSSQLLETIILPRIKVLQDSKPGDALALAEANRRRKAAASKEMVDYQIEEEKEYFRKNRERLNNLATTAYDGLDTARAVGSRIRVPSADDVTQLATVLPSVKEALCRPKPNTSSNPNVPA
jgi:hypothetical protein